MLQLGPFVLIPLLLNIFYVAAATALAASYPRPALLRPGEPHPHLPPGYSPHAHAAALLGRPYEEQLAQVRHNSTLGNFIIFW